MAAKKKATTFDDMVEETEVEEEHNAAETPSTALDVYSDTPLFDPDDILIPRLRLAQGLTAEVGEGTAKPGQWLISGFEAEDSVLIVPLLFGRMREMRDQDTREILCVSRGAENGIGEPGGICAECVEAKWVDDGDGRRPPACSFMYAYIVYSHTHDTLASLSFQRTQIPAGKMMNTIVKRTGLAKSVIHLTSLQREGKRGKFFVPAMAQSNEDEKEILAAAKVKAAEGL